MLLFFLTQANNRRMSSKIHSKQRKDTQKDHKRIEHMEKIRIIQDCLVFVSGLPASLADPALLKTDDYFGRYGKVLKVVINSPSSYRKTTMAQAYITYGTQLEASMAIVALDGYAIEDKSLKVSYGTTKYCTHFLRGYQCQNQECFYLHKVDKSRQVLNGDSSRNSFQDQNDRAFEVVGANMEEVVQMMVEEPPVEVGLPSLVEMVDFLIDSKFITRARVNEIARKYRAPQKLVVSTSSPPPGNNIECPNQARLLTKCNSLSTMASPTKSQIEQKVPEKANKNQIIPKSEKVDKLSPPQEPKQQDNRESLEQQIQRMIIKKMLDPAPKSRLPFAQGSSSKHPHELIKLKAIVRKYLIAAN